MLVCLTKELNSEDTSQNSLQPENSLTLGFKEIGTENLSLRRLIGFVEMVFGQNWFFALQIVSCKYNHEYVKKQIGNNFWKTK